jgi:hypothetical protein
MVPPLWKNHEFSGCIEFSAVWQMLDLFFPQCHPTSAEDMLPFNKSKIFTWSLKFSTLTFTLLLGHSLLFGRHNYTKLRTGKQQIIQQFKCKVGLTKNFSASTELHNTCWVLKLSVLNFLLIYLDHTWSKLSVIKPQIGWIYCNVTSVCRWNDL